MSALGKGEKMPRLIDADALKYLICANVYPIRDDFNSTGYGMFWTGGIEKAIDEMPTVEAVRHGHWIRNDNGTYSCSKCQSWIPDEQHYYARYCLFCGARMDEVENDF